MPVRWETEQSMNPRESFGNNTERVTIALAAPRETDRLFDPSLVDEEQTRCDGVEWGWTI
jgi:hypothetical protein